MNSGFKIRYLIPPILFIIFIWWFVKQLKKEEMVSSDAMEITVADNNNETSSSTLDKSTKQKTSLQKDETNDKSKPKDLTTIKGIGPKIASALKKSGIDTISQLASSQTSDIAAILENNGIRAGNIDQWIEQAKKLN